MTPDEQLAFVAEHHRAVLITRRQDGRLQSSPIACGVVDGHAAISVTQDRAKTRNIRRDPRVSVCVLSDEWYGPWTQIDGTAEVVDLPEAMDGLVALYRSVAGEHPDWDDYRAAMERDGRCLIRITPDPI
jgi:PPOX class probable F420-dependent enzyme